MASKKYKGMYYRETFTYENKRYEITAKTKTELAEKVLKKKEQLKAGTEKIYNPTLIEYYEHFTNVRRREIKESTLRSQKIQFNFIAYSELAENQKFGFLKIKDITRRNIEDVREILASKPENTPQYINNCFAHLNHVFNSALTDGTIDKNVCARLKQLKRDSLPISETKHRGLSESETITFFRQLSENKSYYENILLLMIKTGMRIGEASALYPTDIDRKNGFIHIRRTIQRDENGAYIVGDSTKTISGARDIPLTDEVYNIIKNQQERNRVLFGLESAGLIFRSAEGNILREYCVNREIKRICKQTNVKPFTCHCLRNTYATRFIEQRPQDYKILSELLGHKDISISLNLYTHVMTENKVAAVNDLLIKTS